MIQDIAPHKFHNEFLPYSKMGPEADSYLVVTQGHRLFCRVNHNTLELPKVKDVQAGFFRYLVACDGNRFYMPVENEKDIAAELQLKMQGFDFIPVREIRKTEPAWMCFTAISAVQTALWYKNNIFCGHCGTQMVESDKERMMECPKCKNMVYPRLNPVVITGIVNGEKILMAENNGHDTGHVHYSLIAGFVELGESLEQAIRREVMEETGLEVKNIKYYASQPWPVSDSLISGFFCEVDGDDHVTVDKTELNKAFWASRDEIPFDKTRTSITQEMLMQFKFCGRDVLR